MNWFRLAFGAVSILGGIAMIIWRDAISRSDAAQQRAFFGKLGERVARSASPRNTGWVGVAAIAIGTMAILTGLFSEETSRRGGSGGPHVVNIEGLVISVIQMSVGAALLLGNKPIAKFSHKRLTATALTSDRVPSRQKVRAGVIAVGCGLLILGAGLGVVYLNVR